MAKKNRNNALNATDKFFSAANKEGTQNQKIKKPPSVKKSFSHSAAQKATSNPGAFTPASKG